MRLVFTNTFPKISRLVAQLQAQWSNCLARVLFVMHMNVSTVNVTCKIVCFLSCWLLFEPLRVVVNGWGRALMS